MNAEGVASESENEVAIMNYEFSILNSQLSILNCQFPSALLT